MSNDFERTYEFDVASIEDGTGLEVGILCALVTPKGEPVDARQGSVPVDVVLQRWTELAANEAGTVERDGTVLRGIFPSVQAAMDCAETLRTNHLFESETEHRIGFHAGRVEKNDGRFEGVQIDLTAIMARKANPNWVLATRAVYDRLTIENQMKLYSLDFVALTRTTPPMEVFRVADGTDYLGANDEPETWGPYSTLTLQRDDETIVIDADNTPFAIGRGKSSDLRLDDMFVSVEHAAIDYRDREFMLLDTSSNGTFVGADGEPPFRSPRTFKLRKPGSLWFGRPPGDKQVRPFRFDFD